MHSEEKHKTSLFDGMIDTHNIGAQNNEEMKKTLN